MYNIWVGSLYKNQSGIERNFGFLKDPVIVNSVFLKKPERIEVLGMILVVSLLIWRLLERSMLELSGKKRHHYHGMDQKKNQETDLIHDDDQVYLYPGYKRERTKIPCQASKAGPIGIP